MAGTIKGIPPIFFTSAMIADTTSASLLMFLLPTAIATFEPSFIFLLNLVFAICFCAVSKILVRCISGTFCSI
jgi:hypothetical protein